MKDGTKTDIKIGLSGCTLKMVDGKIIRKSSHKKSFNNRLNTQVDKQLSFNNIIQSDFHTPQIYKSGVGYFDMEYIPGESYYNFFNKCSKQDLDNLLLKIKSYFNELQTYKKPYTPLILKQKLNTKLDSLYKNSNYKPFIKYLVKNLDNNSFNNIPKTFCHGDLSLTNIIFYKNRAYLIDFLDSYVDSFIVDLVKLQQDLRFKWALNIHGGNLRIHQCFNYLWDNLYSEYKEYYDLEFTKIVNILNWLRIEPYLSDKKHKDVLKSIITNLEHYEEFNSTNSRQIK
jgi:hypothetical protein|tara:strand:- start:218 stop:1072 length:855 start_codon:yes stop_codon:yes gene_type:complete